NGTVNVTDRSVSYNTVGPYYPNAGHGIWNGTGTVIITRSTINNNGVTDPYGGSDGGGIVNEGGFVSLSNCTVTENIADYYYGILNRSGTIELVSTTICRHPFGYESVDNLPGANIIVRSTIIDGAPSGFFISFGFNLIRFADNSTGFTQPSDQTGTLASPLDPLLDPNGLQDNGGPTLTIALLPGSPAVDKGINTVGSTDQRGDGFPRTIDDPAIPNAVVG